MNKENNIIAIRKTDCNLAYQAFQELMQKTEGLMNANAKAAPDTYKTFAPNELEECSCRVIQQACHDTPFNPKEVILVSGHSFPDIVAEKYYGIEVKMTKDDKWTSIGSSIVESTRVKKVEEIYMLFGKMGGKVPEFRCRPYQDVLTDISVTHSPRYLINMDLKPEDNIFYKMGTTYQSFRTSETNIEQVRAYFMQKAKEKKRVSMPWWVSSVDSEKPSSFDIVLWKTLSKKEKRQLQAMCMILFPEALNPGRSMTKYNNTTLWLCSCKHVVNPNVRDMYSAGGKITKANNSVLNKPAAQVFNQIVEYATDIKEMLRTRDSEFEAMIQEFNPQILREGDAFENWLNICYGYADANRVPLRDWIANKPAFEFSK